MTLQQWLVHATERLKASGIDTARLDALVLLEDVTQIGRASILAHPKQPLTTAQCHALNKFITQRQDHLPLAYIRGKVAFYGRDFYVSPAVLVPRPETEGIIDQLRSVAPTLPQTPHIVDIGTGSGCVGITAKLELPQSNVELLDIDIPALAIARRNARLLNADVRISQSNLLENYTASADVLLANLPYVPNDYPINKAALHEPAIALFSGNDGLTAYRELWKQIVQLNHKPAHIIIEALPEQFAQLAAIAAKHRYTLANANGFVLHFVL